MRRFKLFFSLLVIAVLILAGCSSETTHTEEQIKEGETLFAAGDYKAAAQVYEAVTRQTPDETTAWMGLASSRLKLGNTRGAAEAYQHILDIDPSHTEARLQMARFSILEGNLDKAEERVRAVLKSSPGNVPALYLLADIYIRNKRFEDARDVYQQIIEKTPRETAAYIGLARFYNRAGDLSKAADYLRQSIAVAPRADAPRLMLFSLYHSQHNNEAAEETLLQAVAANPKKALWPVMLGRFYFDRQQTEKAENAFLSAIEKEPENVTPYLVAGKFYGASGDMAKALSMYRRALDLQPQNITIRYLLADFLLKSNDAAAAAKQISEILDKHPDYLPAHLLEIKRLIAQEDYDKALLQCDGLLQTHPAADDLYYLKGLALVGKNDLPGAAEAFLKATRVAPHNIHAAMMLTRIYLKQGRMEEAQQVNRQVFALLHKNFNIDLILGNTSLQAGKQQSIESMEALSEFASVDPLGGYARQEHVAALQDQHSKLIDEFEAVLATDPTLMGLFENIIILHAANNEYDVALGKCDRQLQQVGASPELAAAIYNIKGGLLLAQGKIRGAQQAFQEAIRTNPDFLKPYFGLARLYIVEKNLDKAISQYQAVLARNPRQVGPHVLLGALYKLKGDYKQAESHYRKALSIDANSIQAANNLAYLLAENTDNMDEALSLSLKAKAIAPEDPFVRDTLGWIYYKKGLYEDAVRELSACVEALPDNAIAHYHLGMAHYQRQETDLAVKHLQRALSLDKQFEQAREAESILIKLKPGNTEAQ